MLPRNPKGNRFAPKYEMPTVKMVVAIQWFRDLSIVILLVHFIEGIMDKNVYLDIIKNVMLPYGKDKMVGFSSKTTQSIVQILSKLFQFKTNLTFGLAFSKLRFKSNRTSLGTS